MAETTKIRIRLKAFDHQLLDKSTSDIVETAIAPSWQDIGRLAAIAVIRTFLNFFLERDLAEIRERQSEGRRDTAAGK